jgi:hypothetical protein
MKLFRIEPIDRIQAIRILGNSIPAVATSTAVASGLASLHFLKLLQHRDALSQAHSLAFEHQEKLRSLFYSADVNLETLLPTVYDANPVAQRRVGKVVWTTWDFWRLKENARVMDLWDELRSRGIDLRMLSDVRFVECFLFAFLRSK